MDEQFIIRDDRESRVRWLRAYQAVKEIESWIDHTKVWESSNTTTLEESIETIKIYLESVLEGYEQE